MVRWLLLGISPLEELWSDGTTMWVADNADNKLYAYNLSTKARDASKDFDTLRAAGNDNPLGLWSDGATMWVSSDGNGNDKIYSYSMANRQYLGHLNSTSWDLHSDNDDPGGIWSDGTTIWVADVTDSKILCV